MRSYTGVDTSQTSLNIIGERIRQKGEIFDHRLINFEFSHDPSVLRMHNIVPHNHASCFIGMEELGSLDLINNFFQNVSSVLEVGGYFFGIFQVSFRLSRFDFSVFTCSLYLVMFSLYLSYHFRILLLFGLQHKRVQIQKRQK